MEQYINIFLLSSQKHTLVHIRSTLPRCFLCVPRHTVDSLSKPRLFWITAYLEVKLWSLPKHENQTTGKKKYCGKEEKLLLWSNFSSFPQYFQHISNYKSPITYMFVKCGCLNYFFLNSSNWYVEVWISRSISESPLEFEIMRVLRVCCMFSQNKKGKYQYFLFAVL